MCALALVACSTEERGRRDAINNPIDTTSGGNDGADASTPSTAGTNTGGDTTGSSANGVGTTGGASTGGASTGGASTGGSTGSAEVVRFVVLGDGGTGEAAQIKVAAAMKKVCADRGCSFALYLGDNIYDSGASSEDDEQFKSKFEDPYVDLDIPFYVVLGNHDYGNNGANILPEDARSAAQVEYTARSEKWNMPHYFYTFREGPVAFFGLDTNSIVIDRFRPAAMQRSWLDAEIKKSDAPWKIVFGHHPYLSNGQHGNAGSYDGVFFNNGARMKDLVEGSVCGKAQLYFAGHDHDREWIEDSKCATSFVVSGAAAKLRGVGSSDRQLFGDASKYGFMWVEIDGDAMTGVFYDEDAKVSYEDMVMRQ